MTSPIRIHRCICANRSFAELLTLARKEQLDLAQLTARTGCGGGCRACLPYLRRMLRTGETEFSELLPPESGA